MSKNNVVFKINIQFSFVFPMETVIKNLYVILKK